MALENESGGIGATMLVGPTGGYPMQSGGFGGGFGGDWGWIVLLLLLAGGGWGNGASAGVFNVDGSYARSSAGGHIGFRSAYVELPTA